MALYSMVVEHEGKSFTTQIAGRSIEEAVRAFFARPMAASISPALTPEDIIYVTPMEGLVNTWAVCAGREGRYVSITAVRAVEEPGA
jgi:hypothetical protein